MPQIFKETAEGGVATTPTGLRLQKQVFADSLAKEGKPGDSYYSMMKWNLDKIHEGLMK
jgi:iron/zinc/copper transport system substrate-binding protein